MDEHDGLAERQGGNLEDLPLRPGGRNASRFSSRKASSERGGRLPTFSITWKASGDSKICRMAMLRCLSRFS
jgi:hypothetical protein